MYEGGGFLAPHETEFADSDQKIMIHKKVLAKTRTFSGDGGIRTRVPRRANAFRVRPVMTTSIRLHKILVKYTIFCAFCKVINKKCNKIKISLQKCKRMCYTNDLRGMA